MRLGLSKLLYPIYRMCKLLLLELYFRILGFEYVNCQLHSVDKRILIPLLRKYGATIGENCDLEVPLYINTKAMYHSLKIGNGCYIGKNVTLDIKGGIELQDKVTVSFGVTLISHIDVGTSGLKRMGYDTTYNKVLLKDSSYIGASSVILHGVTIGEYAVVGAGSVVTEDVPPFSIVCGVPAKVVKKLEV